MRRVESKKLNVEATQGLSDLEDGLVGGVEAMRLGIEGTPSFTARVVAFCSYTTITLEQWPKAKERERKKTDRGKAQAGRHWGRTSRRSWA